MSIFNKILILFCISISLMMFLSYKTNKMSNENIEYVHKQKYIQAAKELLNFIVNSDEKALEKRSSELDYSKITSLESPYIWVYQNDISFGTIKILKNENGYYLYIKYLDEEFFFYDNSQIKEFEQNKFLNYLIIADTSILVIMLLIILKLLNPLKNISKAIEKFGMGDFSYRLKDDNSKDEISKITNEFNSMAKNLESLITARSQFLNDVSHELRTPISKAKLSLEMIEESKYQRLLKKSIDHIDKLTNELLEIERLNSNNSVFNLQTYKIETILAEALSKTMIDDEDEIKVNLVGTFTCRADFDYLSTAIKNLIDNALKYKEKDKVEISVLANSIKIENHGSSLNNELDFYTKPFTQDKKNNNGFGLGLNIVYRILERHGYKLSYHYKNNKNCFSITF